MKSKREKMKKRKNHEGLRKNERKLKETKRKIFILIFRKSELLNECYDKDGNHLTEWREIKTKNKKKNRGRHGELGRGNQTSQVARECKM